MRLPLSLSMRSPIRSPARSPMCLRRALCLALGMVSISLGAQAASSEAEAVHALQRLSFGPAPGQLSQVMDTGVDAYTDAQLRPEALPLPMGLQTRLDALSTLKMTQTELITGFRELERAVRNDPEAGQARRKAWQQQVRTEAAQARLWRSVESPRQLEEVMVDFWFNHFNVFEGKGLDHALMANYEREAIRPHAMGRFRDLLGAVTHHAAMLFYLDNWMSVGPGRGGNKGLNENHARELMELHTLGVDGGYTQGDVTELARILTGWTLVPTEVQAPRRARQIEELQAVARSHSRPALPSGSAFLFDPTRHDHGDKIWLGHTVSDRGQDEGEWALDVLAMHPSTAHHIALKLARAFVSEAPPPELVQALSRRYLETGGDIRAVLDTLLHSPAFRDPAVRGTLFKTPYRYVVSAVRATGAPLEDVHPLSAALQQLGMPLYGCQTPDGYHQDQATWLSPDALTRRVQWATNLASGRPMKTAPPDASALMQTWGAAVSASTRVQVVQAEPGLRAALVLGSPDAMRH